MSGVLTPLEHRENTACHEIAVAVACEHSPAKPGTFAAGAVVAANDIAERILARALSSTLAPDPFRACAFPGCDEECLGPFCKAHADQVPFDLFQSVVAAVVTDDRTAYGAALARAIAAIWRGDVKRQAV